MPFQSHLPLGIVLLLVCLHSALAQNKGGVLGDGLPAGATGRLGTSSMRYSAARPAAGSTYAADGNSVLVIAGSDFESWDMRTGSLLFRHSLSEKQLVCLDRSPDGKRVLVADEAGTVREWDLKSARVVNQFKTGRAALVTCLYSPDGKRVLTLDKSTSIVEEWNLKGGKLRKPLKVPATMWFGIYGPGAKTVILSHHTSPAVYHYDLATGKLLKRFVMDQEYARGLALSRTGERLLVGSRDWASEWDLKSYKRLKVYSGHPGGEATAVAYLPGEEEILTGARNGEARVYNRASGRFIRKFVPHQRAIVRLEVSPDGKKVLSYGTDNLIAETIIETGKPRLDLERHLGAIRSIAFSPDGSKVATGSEDGSIRLWNAGDGEPVARLAIGVGIYGLTFLPGGECLCAAARNGCVYRVPLQGGKNRYFRGSRGYVRAVASVGRNDRVLSAGDGGQLILHNLAANRPLRYFRGHRGGVMTLAVAPGGRRFLSGGRDGTIREWDLESGECRQSWIAHAGCVQSVAYDRTGEFALSGGRDGAMVEWNLKDGSVSRIFKHGAWVEAVCYAAAGRLVCAAGREHEITVWDRESGRLVKRLSGHRDAVLDLHYDPKRKRLFSASADTTALIWKLPG